RHDAGRRPPRQRASPGPRRGRGVGDAQRAGRRARRGPPDRRGPGPAGVGGGHRGARRTGVEPGAPAVALGRLVTEQRGLRLRGLQGYAGQCAHVMGWAARGEASRRAMTPLMETRTQFEKAGLPVEIVAGGSAGTYDIDVELPGLTELQSGSYCVMDLDYRQVGGRAGDSLTDFEMAITV